MASEPDGQSVPRSSRTITASKRLTDNNNSEAASIIPRRSGPQPRQVRKDGPPTPVTATPNVSNGPSATTVTPSASSASLKRRRSGAEPVRRDGVDLTQDEEDAIAEQSRAQRAATRPVTMSEEEGDAEGDDDYVADGDDEEDEVDEPPPSSAAVSEQEVEELEDAPPAKKKRKKSKKGKEKEVEEVDGDGMTELLETFFISLTRYQTTLAVVSARTARE
ncbi:hypothetical protein SISNIDRAFT_487057 [Sistotremastrum niveocremeum HHB9708]|uniref:Uncharacterized protein n=1 Tax=Sistotremastrum niveocremeum HHB9708 TaxID=1314777 RepID=A0A164SRQ6_9AGAM|nr:hypothetical protein SISNIDRAFT_487057 [Sistotremastrum niveocremeum HHB9708]